MKHVHVTTANLSEVYDLVKELVGYNLFHSWEEGFEFDKSIGSENKTFFEKSNCFSDPRSEEAFMIIEDAPGVIMFGVFDEVGVYKIECLDDIFFDEQWMFIQNNGITHRLIALKKGTLKKEKADNGESVFDT